MTYLKKLSLFIIALLFISMPLLAQPEPEAEPYIVDLTATDYAFAMPSEIKSGWVTFRFNNIGNATHYALIEKKHPRMPVEIFKECIKNREYLSASPVGGPGFHSSGAKSEMSFFLDPGHYALVCNAQTKEGETHKELGMVKYLQVLEEENGAPEPEADYQVNLNRYYIKASKPFSEGRQTIAINHTSGAVFDLHFFERDEASRLDGALDFMVRLQDPQDVHFMGGVEQGLAESTSYLTLDFEAGNYGMSSHEFGHFGMYRQFSVSESPAENQFVENIEDKNRRILEFSAGANESRLGFPEELKAGPSKLIFTNTTDEVHQPAIFRLQEEKSIGDFLAAMKSIAEDHKPPRTHDHVERPILGMFLDFTPAAPGESHGFNADLLPDRYVVICFTPENGQPHYLGRDEVYRIDVR